jgi:hypothetical protein
MTEFRYVVTVKVPDEGMPNPTTKFMEEYHFEADWDAETGEIPFFTPKTLADIVMGERLGPDEDYGFEYRVDYEAQATPPLPPRVDAIIQEIKSVLPEGGPEDWENDACFSACSAIKGLVDPVPDAQYRTIRIPIADFSVLDQLVSFETDVPGDNWSEEEVESLGRLRAAL